MSRAAMSAVLHRDLPVPELIRAQALIDTALSIDLQTAPSGAVATDVGDRLVALLEATRSVLTDIAAVTYGEAATVIDSPSNEQAATPVPSRELLLVFDASSEIECLVASLRDIVRKEAQAMGDEAAILLQSGLKNINRLNSVLMSLAIREGRRFPDLYSQVHDELPHSQAQVSHA